MASLSFSLTNGEYKATFTSSGNPTAVQLQREAPGELTFCASIDDLDPQPIRGYGRQNAGVKFITSINVPKGVKVTILSQTNVIKASYTS